jgi:diguanylate cyclase (GGDEF)-like protein/PAS domain S-box-containing protein
MATIAFDGPEAGRVLRVNEAFCRITGYTPGQLVGTTFVDYLRDEDSDQTDREIERLTTGKGPYRFERTFRRTDGNDIWLGGTAAIVDQGKDQPQIILIQIDDVTARKDEERELRHHAAHDPLTGLPNRRLLQHHFTSALQRSRQTGRRGALLFCDLNHFKQVNDKYGHETGDKALREIADRLLTEVRHGDTVARLGGDEFAILAEDIDGDDLDVLTRRISEAIGRPLDGIDVPVTASIGTAIVSPYASDLNELLRTADNAMYEAKRQHRR